MLLITNIGELCVVPRGPVGGARMNEVQRIRNAELLIDGERIAWFGPAAESRRWFWPILRARSLE